MIQWERNEDFQDKERVLKENHLLQGPPESRPWQILNAQAFDDLLFGFFTAWAFKVLAREQYNVCFVPLDSRHTLLVVRHRPYPSLFPGDGVALFNDTFVTRSEHAPFTLTGLRAKLLYNASLSRQRRRITETDFARFTNAASLRRFVVEQTLRQPDVFGWLFGGHPLLLAVPPKVFERLLTAEEPDTKTLMNTFEALLCIKLGVETRAQLFTCHVIQKQPLVFNEADIVLYFPSPESIARRTWKAGQSAITLAEDIKDDRVFVLENSSGFLDPDDPEFRRRQRDESADFVPEPEDRLFPKLANLLALRNAGFQTVQLHLCSLVSDVPIANEPLRNILSNDPLISIYRLPSAFATDIANGTWTSAKMRRACNTYVNAALQSACALKA